MDKIIKNTTCFKEQKLANKACTKSTCRQFINCKKYLNCTLLAAKEGARTLQQIGDLHGLTRMRICQLEKSALKKIKENIFN